MLLNCESCNEVSSSTKNTTTNVTFNQQQIKQNEENPKKITEVYEYEEVLDLIGFGWTQWSVLLMIGLNINMVLNETMGGGFLTILSQCDFKTTAIEKSVLSAACFIGISMSSYFWGYLSDTIGRRTTILYSTAMSMCTSFISMFAPNYTFFLSLRIIVGIFAAGASSTSYAYLGEFFVKRHRPIVINYASMFVGFSAVYVPAVVWLVTSFEWSFVITSTFIFRSWRLVNFFFLLPGLISFLILLNLPESPKYFLSLNKENEALKVVDWICKRNTGQTLEHLKVQKLKCELSMSHDSTLLNSKTVVGVLKYMWKETLPLFRRPVVIHFAITCFVMFGAFMCSSGLGLWYPEIQNRLGANNEKQLSVCQIIDSSIAKFELEESLLQNKCVDTINIKSLLDSITYGCSFIIGFLLLGIIINPVGRKRVIIISLCIASVCGLLLLWIVQPMLIVACFCLNLMLPGLCISMLSGALVDLVPTYLRGKAVCICLMIGRSGSIFGSNIVGVLLDNYCNLTFGFFSVFSFICALLTLLLPI